MRQKEQLGTYIKKCRKKKRLTQLEVSKMIGISVKSYKRIENNHSAPKMHTLQLICRVLHIDTADVKWMYLYAIKDEMQLFELADLYFSRGERRFAFCAMSRFFSLVKKKKRQNLITTGLFLIMKWEYNIHESIASYVYVQVESMTKK